MNVSDIVGKLNSTLGLALQSADYVGYVSLRITDSQQIAVTGSSNQVHLAVTGDAMTLFPVVTSVPYERGDSDVDLAHEKRRYTFVFDVTTYVPNLRVLTTRTLDRHDATFREPKVAYSILEADLVGRTDASSSSKAVCAFNIRRQTGQRQLEIGAADHRSDFHYLRLCLLPGDVLVLLKRSTAAFDAVGVPSEQIPTGESWVGHHVEPATSRQSVPHANVHVGIAPEPGDPVHDLLLRRKNVVLYGPPGTGKTHRALSIARAWRAQNGQGSVFAVTFHPSYSYEDFIEGFRPDERNPGRFLLQPGLLLAAIARADGSDNSGPAVDVLMLIDEINRADVARVFGEAITYIEATKRGERFRLSQRPGLERSIPENLYVLGTMNTADKSVSLLDVALRRRFAFVEMPPSPTELIENHSWLERIDGVDVPAVVESVNSRLLGIGIPVDRAIGHTLLGVLSTSSDPRRDLIERVKYDLFPLVEEYCYFDRTRVASVLPGLVDARSGRLLPLRPPQFIAVLRTLSNAGEGGTSSAASGSVGATSGITEEEDASPIAVEQDHYDASTAILGVPERTEPVHETSATARVEDEGASEAGG